MGLLLGWHAVCASWRAGALWHQQQPTTTKASRLPAPTQLAPDEPVLTDGCRAG